MNNAHYHWLYYCRIPLDFGMLRHIFSFPFQNNYALNAFAVVERDSKIHPSKHDHIALMLICLGQRFVLAGKFKWLKSLHVIMVI